MAAGSGRAAVEERLPGRLGDPDLTLVADPRVDPRLAAVFGAEGTILPGMEPVAPEASYEECLAYCAALESASDAQESALLASLPAFDGVESTTETIAGVDGNAIALHLDRPADGDGPWPAIVHLHGGGMVMSSAGDPTTVRWRRSLAEMGVLVVGVEFRNGGGKLGNHPFPAGLDDCAAAVRWVDAQRAHLGVSTVVVSGESGGGNLCLATALKAGREGWIDRIDGVYALCPYISGAYAEPPAELVSLRENDGYGGMHGSMFARLAKAYDRGGPDRTDPLAWPLHASVADLAGLPPHIVSVNELDPLRDEGLAYYRKLAAAGVPAVARTVHGTSHGADVMFDVIPEVCAETLRSIVGFARSL